jgi:hypothetical protein
VKFSWRHFAVGFVGGVVLAFIRSPTLGLLTIGLLLAAVVLAVSG